MVELVLVVRGPEVLARQFEPVGSQKPVIMPPALLASRQSTIGGKFVAAEILVDAPEVVLDSLVVDMSAANVTGCAPAVAGVYVRDASGSLTNLEISGAHATTTPDCDTRVGPPHRGGTIGDIFGQPLLGKAVVSLSNSSFTNNQKGGVVVLGNRAIVKIKDSQALGGRYRSTRSPERDRAERRRQGARSGCAGTPLPDHRGRQDRHGSVAHGGPQGAHTPGHDHRRPEWCLRRRRRYPRARQAAPRHHVGCIVFLGQKNRALGNLIDVSSVSGVFIDGDRNAVRGGHMSDMPVGVWFFAGNHDISKGIQFTNVPERVGDVRDLTLATADPFNLDCATVADCNDGNPCTVDACDAATGVCSYTTFPTPRPARMPLSCNGSEVCVAGVCQIGTPLVCVDGNECTSDSCDAALGCQFTPVADGTACNSGMGQCIARVCS
jgi:Dictyostelium (slime mold) repeat